MTNAQIIFNRQIALMKEGKIEGTGRIITVLNAAGEMVQIEEPEQIHTYAMWKQLGFQVKKGAKAVDSFTIWKHTSKKGEMEVTYTDGTTGTEEVENSNMFMKKAAFFTASQVEKIENKTA